MEEPLPGWNNYPPPTNYFGSLSYIVKCLGKQHGYGNKLFHFQAACIIHSDFKNIVNSNWNKGRSLKENNTTMASVLDEWNKNIFGNIHKNKRRLLARIDGIQKRLDVLWYHRLVKLGAKLKEEVDEILAQEELMWSQKSNDEWIQSLETET